MSSETTTEVIFRIGLFYGSFVAAANVGSVIFWWFVAAGKLPFLSVGARLDTAQVSLLPLIVTLMMLSSTIFAATLLFSFLAGMSTSRKIGRVSPGALAGVVAGDFAGVMGAITRLAVIFVIPHFPQQSGSATFIPADPPQILGVVLAILGLALDCCLGAALGALGGLVGADRYHTMRPEPPQGPSYSEGAWSPGAYPFPFAPYPTQFAYPAYPPASQPPEQS